MRRAPDVNCCALMTDAFASAVSDILGEDAVTDAAGVAILERLRHTPHGRFIDLKGASSPAETFVAAMARARVADEDLPQFMPQLDTLFDALDFNVARTAIVLGRHLPDFAVDKAVRMRIGSIAADLTQQAFYWRVAASPGIRRICEVGFNAGHSTALWLTANPTATVVSFDLFNNMTDAYKGRNLDVLQSVFPGRLREHRGDSLHTVPSAHIEPRCDLVHVDGRHSYENTVKDAMNLMAKSHPTALYLFDDQCDVHDCRGSNNFVASRPTLATCDLVAAGLLRPITAVYNGTRQFALFRQGAIRVNHSSAHGGHFGQAKWLPCERCTLNMTVSQRHEKEAKATVQSLVEEQHTLRDKACRAAPEMPWRRRE